MGVYEERAPPNTGMHWQPANSQERGGNTSLALGCQGTGSATIAGDDDGANVVTATGEQTRDLSPCLPVSMGDAARSTALPSSPPLPRTNATSSADVNQQQQSRQIHTNLRRTHCGTNNNCYSSNTTPYDSRDFVASPGEPCAFHNNNYEHPIDLGMGPHHYHHHQHHQHHVHQSTIHHQNSNQTGDHNSGAANSPSQIPKLEPPSSPPPPHQNHNLDAENNNHGNPSFVCAGCGLRISDRFYLEAVDRRWHASCLQCSHCRQRLDGEITCFSRDGNIYCKKDYYRMFGSMKRCARCQAAILATELVMRARHLVFHVRCFSCAACSVPLTKGDHFGMRDTTVLCRMHYEMSSELHPSRSPPVSVYPPGPPFQRYPSPEFLRSQHNSSMPSHLSQSQHQTPGSGVITPNSQEAGSPTKMGYFNGTSSAPSGTLPNVNVSDVPAPRQKGRPRKRKPKDLDAMSASLDLNADYIDMPFGRGGPGTPGMPGSNSRTKRMRTSFKHHQLRTMKSYFAINHNPDAKDLKQLSQKTGLPKRVLQVWFQNARAKWRRMVLKQEGKSEKSGGVGGGVDAGSLSELDIYGNNTSSGGPPMSPPFGVLTGPHSPASMGSLDCA